MEGSDDCTVNSTGVSLSKRLDVEMGDYVIVGIHDAQPSSKINHKRPWQGSPNDPTVSTNSAVR